MIRWLRAHARLLQGPLAYLSAALADRPEWESAETGRQRTIEDCP